MANQTIQTNLLGQRVEVCWNDFSGEPTGINQSDYGTIRSVFLIDGRSWYTVEMEGLGNENIGTLKDFPQERVIVNCSLRKEYLGEIPSSEDIISKRREREKYEAEDIVVRLPPDACRAIDGSEHTLETASCMTKDCDSCTHTQVGNDRCVPRK